MVKLQGLTACFVNLKVGCSNRLLGNTSTMDFFFHYTLQLHGIHPPNQKIQNAIFFSWREPCNEVGLFPDSFMLFFNTTHKSVIPIYISDVRYEERNEPI